MKVQIETQGFRSLQRRVRLLKRRVEAVVRHLVRFYAEAIEADARRNAPVDDGTLRGSFAVMKRGLMAAAYNTAEHAKPIEFGADPHPITPSDAGALHFFWERVGQWVTFGRVEHPGNDAFHYFRDAVRKQWPQLKKALEANIRRVISNA